MITDFLLKHNMLPEGARVLCAVSGGADSVCMLHLLKSMEGERHIEVFAAHFEHGIRGEESQRDADFVKVLCERLSVPFMMGHGEVPEYAKAHGLSIEEAARKLRYDFLREAKQSFKCDCIATAHNADDNAETVIFNLTRGSAAVRGIPPLRGDIIRPLLGTKRSEIEAYLSAHELAHVEDSTNASDDYSRNRLRHQVLPVLRELNPNMAALMLQAAELSARDEEFFSTEAKHFLERELKNNELSLKTLRALHPSVRSRAYRLLSTKTLEAKHVEAIEAMLNSNERKCLDLPGLKLSLQQGRVLIGEAEATRIKDIEVPINGILALKERKLEIISEFTAFPQVVYDLLNIFYFNRDNICGTVTLSARRSGDKLRPMGRKCTKTLKQLFMEAGYTQKQRDEALVLRDEKGILAVLGLAQDERTRAKAGERVLKISVRRMKDE